MACIGIFDSGAGGLSVLKEILRVLPSERYIYYADTAHCPYGEKTTDYIFGRSLDITRSLLKQGADAIVIACNTATAASVKKLREMMPDVPFVGMEPAIKPAAALSKTGAVGVLATASTLKAAKYLNTKEKFSNGVRIVERIGRGFVELVESGRLDGPDTRKTVEASLCPLLDENADTIVLGCTHYPFLLPVMRDIAGEGINFVDPAPAVAKRLLYVLKSNNIALNSTPADTPMVQIESSGSPDTTRRLYETILL